MIYVANAIKYKVNNMLLISLFTFHLCLGLLKDRGHGVHIPAAIISQMVKDPG